MQRLSTEFIAIHCSATPSDMEVDEEVIREWHKDRGWSDIGYNVLILRDGTVQIGRPLDERGAHVRGFNSRALGVCLVGGVDDAGQPEDNFTPAQFDSLEDTIVFLRRYAPHAKVQGHRDFPGVTKACPSFDVDSWMASRGLSNGE